ncbi:MAG TPA: hypothetical protein PLN52_09925 [Opitutaceae bacterium]|nr:hypothetical protein [Opitutaceae bacterium]
MNTSNNHAFINQLLVYTLVMICFSGSIGLGTVWLRHQISETANVTRRLDTQIADLERRLADTHIQVAREETFEALARRNAEWRLGLVAPTESQVRRVVGSPERRLSILRNRELYNESVPKGAEVRLGSLNQ